MFFYVSCVCVCSCPKDVLAPFQNMSWTQSCQQEARSSSTWTRYNIIFFFTLSPFFSGSYSEIQISFIDKTFEVNLEEQPVNCTIKKSVQKSDSDKRCTLNQSDIHLAVQINK